MQPKKNGENSGWLMNATLRKVKKMIERMEDLKTSGVQ